MFDLTALTTIAVVFLLAGAVKGVIGLGLPTVSLGLLAAAFDLTTAMALLIVPSLLTQRLAGVLGRQWAPPAEQDLAIPSGGDGERVGRRDCADPCESFSPLHTAGSIADHLCCPRPGRHAHRDLPQAGVLGGPGARHHQRRPDRDDRFIRCTGSDVPAGARTGQERTGPGHGHAVHRFHCRSCGSAAGSTSLRDIWGPHLPPRWFPQWPACS